MNGYLYRNNNYYEKETLAIAFTCSISVFENNPLTAEFTSSNSIQSLVQLVLYTCNVIIENLSGNNLERLFDRDITKEATIPILKRTFIID